MNFEYKNQTEIDRLLDKYQYRLTHGNPVTRNRMLNVYLRKLKTLAADDEEWDVIQWEIMEIETSCEVYANRA
jgi:hypothetical protein